MAGAVGAVKALLPVAMIAAGQHGHFSGGAPNRGTRLAWRARSAMLIMQ